MFPMTRGIHTMFPSRSLMFVLLRAFLHSPIQADSSMLDFNTRSMVTNRPNKLLLNCCEPHSTNMDQRLWWEGYTNTSPR